MPTGAEVDPESLRRLLAGLKDLPPRVRTDTRRELRSIGDDTIAAQREILSGPLPTGIEKSGWRHTLMRNKKTGARYFGKRNTYRDVEVRNGGRSTGLREGIKSGLKTRVIASEKKQSIEIRTTGPKRGGGNGAKFWDRARFRHPVFGQKRYVDQKGQPYFWRPVMDGRDEMVNRAAEILSRNVTDV